MEVHIEGGSEWDWLRISVIASFLLMVLNLDLYYQRTVLL